MSEQHQTSQDNGGDNGGDNGILDELTDEDRAEAEAGVVTGKSVFCVGPAHLATRQVAMFSQPAHTGWAEFLAAAWDAGWRYHTETGRWFCPACAVAVPPRYERSYPSE